VQGKKCGASIQDAHGVSQVTRLDGGVRDDCLPMIALKLLNPEIPLILRRDVATPGCPPELRLQRADLATGPVPSFLGGSNKAHGHNIDLDKDPTRTPSSLYRPGVSGSALGGKTHYSAQL